MSKIRVSKVPSGNSDKEIREVMKGFEFISQELDNPDEVNFNGPFNNDPPKEKGFFALWEDFEVFLKSKGSFGEKAIQYFKQIERERDVPIPYIFFLASDTEIVV